MMNPVSAVRAVIGLLRLIRDPSELNAVLPILNSTAVHPKVLGEMMDAFAREPQARAAMRERIGLPEIDLEKLRQLPEGTFGRVYAEHMSQNKLDPNLFRQKEARTEGEFVLTHLYETHDIWHVLTGFGTDLNGELGLQAVYLAQLPSRFAVLFMACTFINALLFAFEERATRMRMIVRGWLIGSRARSLLGIRWSDYWEVPLADLRKMFNIDLGTVNMLLPVAPTEQCSVPTALLPAPRAA